MWTWLSRNTIHGKDEVLRLKTIYTSKIPIAEPTDEIRAEAESAARRLIEITKKKQETTRDLLDWLRMEYEIEKPGRKLQASYTLDSDAFIAEVKKRRGRKKTLSASGLRALRDEYAETVEPVRRLLAEADQLERRLSDLVNAAYGLTPEEVDLMWRTAPPRMPFKR